MNALTDPGLMGAVSLALLVAGAALVVALFAIRRRAERALKKKLEHERFRSGALDHALAHDDIESFFDYVSSHILELFGCHQVIYRDIKGRMIIKDRPGTPELDFSLCPECPHYAFDAPVYADGVTVMDDCRVGYRGVSVHPKCRVRASLTRIVRERRRVFGYIALHYLDGTHHFTADEKDTFDGVAKMITLVLSRRKRSEENQSLLAAVANQCISVFDVDLVTGLYTIVKHPDTTSSMDRADRRWDIALGRDFAAECLPETRPIVEKLGSVDFLRSELDGIDHREYPYMHRRSVGGNLYRRATALALERDPGGRAVRALVNFMAIDEAAAVQLMADRRSALLHEIAHSGEWSFTVNAAGDIVGSNHSSRVAELIGNDPGAGGHDWLRLVHPDDVRSVTAAFEATLADRTGRTPFDMEYRMANRDGEYRWFRTSGRLLGHDDGTFELFGMHIDITERVSKRDEQWRRLETALSMAQAANRSKTIFLNSISHDIRTPMNAIIGFTKLAARRVDDVDRVKDCLAKIAKSSEHLLSLINDVLDMSRIESSCMKLEKRPESLVDVIGSLEDILAADVAAKRLDFSVDFSGVRDATIVCDRLRLVQVLLNVLSNAVKYTSEGGRIVFTAAELPAEGARGRYVFTTEDDGCGIDKEFLDHIFLPFERARDTTTSGIQGTGLGMAITKNLVDLMGGDIEVESEPGKGTKVTVSIGFEIADGIGAEPAAAEPVPPRRGGGKRILVVEDNEINREIAVELLRERGYEVDCAENGRAAVEKLTASVERTFDLVLMDIQMPVMDGCAAARAVRAWEREHALARLPIVAVSANAFAEDRAASLEAGMDDHVAKPIKVNELLAVIAERIGGSGAEK